MAVNIESGVQKGLTENQKYKVLRRTSGMSVNPADTLFAMSALGFAGKLLFTGTQADNLLRVTVHLSLPRPPALLILPVPPYPLACCSLQLTVCV